MKFSIYTVLLMGMTINQACSVAILNKREEYKIKLIWDGAVRVTSFWRDEGDGDTKVRKTWVTYDGTSGPTNYTNVLPYGLEGNVTMQGVGYETLNPANRTTGKCIFRMEPNMSMFNETTFTVEGVKLGGPEPVYQNKNHVDMYCQGTPLT